ncbi:MAG: PQQ-binding-like beta-propeller repeat protein [Stenotrophomonas maltophilia]
MEQVRLCNICGHHNPVDGGSRCANCWLSLRRAATLPVDEAERLGRQRRFGHLRLRLLRRGLLLAVLLPLALWWVVAKNDLGPLIWPPPEATTDWNATTDMEAWPQVRRTSQNTGYTADSVPAPQKILWTFETPKPLVASPAVVGNRVYLATDDGRTVALDRFTGAMVWEYKTGFPSSSTPVVAADLVFTVTRPGVVTALEQSTGALRWEQDLHKPILASPIIADGTLYIGASDSNLYALDAATGQLRWSFDATDWITSSVAYLDGNLVVTSQDHNLRVVGAKSGRQRLIYDTGRGRPSPGGAAIQGDVAYFGSLGGWVWAVNRQARTYPFERSLLFWQSTLYVWGILADAPVQKGSIWATKIGGDIPYPPALSGDTVYAATIQGKVVALDAATGEELWSTELDSEITAPPIVAGDTVLIGTESGRVFGLNASNGIVEWNFQIGGKITGSPVVIGKTIFVASHDGKLYALAGGG